MRSAHLLTCHHSPSDGDPADGVSTYICDWAGDLGFYYPPVVVARSREEANEFGTRVLRERFPDITDLFYEDGYLVAVLDGDVTDRLASNHSVINAVTGAVVFHL